MTPDLVAFATHSTFGTRDNRDPKLDSNRESSRKPMKMKFVTLVNHVEENLTRVKIKHSLYNAGTTVSRRQDHSRKLGGKKSP